MKRRILAIILLCFCVMIFIIPVYAADHRVKLDINIIAHQEWNTATVSNTQFDPWEFISEETFNFNGQTMGQPQQMFLFANIDGMFRENQYIVWTFEITNTRYEQITTNKVKITTQTEVERLDTFDKLKNTNYDAQIIAITNEVINESNGMQDIRYTVTIKTNTDSEGKNGLLWWISPLTLYDTSLYNRTVSSIYMYESVESAAGSGTTPEEMREVLSQWSEEELVPNLGEELINRYENYEEQLIDVASSTIEEITSQFSEAVMPYFENTTEIRDALHGGLTGVFGYSGTNAVITLPAANNPLADGAVLWPQMTVDLGYWWNRLPAALRSMITIYATFVILYCCLSEMLDTINTILIHRELLGLPDDQFGIKAKSRGE